MAYLYLKVSVFPQTLFKNFIDKNLKLQKEWNSIKAFHLLIQFQLLTAILPIPVSFVIVQLFSWWSFLASKPEAAGFLTVYLEELLHTSCVYLLKMLITHLTFSPYNRISSLREKDAMPFSIKCVCNSNLLEHLKYSLDYC